MQRIPTTLIFDCFGVISTPPVSSWYQINSQKYGFTDPALSNLLKQYDLGNVTAGDIVKHFLAYPGIRATSEQIQKEIDSLALLNVELISKMEKLKHAGYTIALLSNGSRPLYDRLIFPSHPGLKELFNAIIISSEVHMVKPDEPIYNFTLKKIKAVAPACVFIDDNQANIDTAIRLGMYGTTYTDVPTLMQSLHSIGIAV